MEHTHVRGNSPPLPCPTEPSARMVWPLSVRRGAGETAEPNSTFRLLLTNFIRPLAGIQDSIALRKVEMYIFKVLFFTITNSTEAFFTRETLGCGLVITNFSIPNRSNFSCQKEVGILLVMETQHAHVQPILIRCPLCTRYPTWQNTVKTRENGCVASLSISV